MKSKITVMGKVFKKTVVALLASASIICEILGQIIPNPSFEQDNFTIYPGYISVNSPITGWTGTPPDRVGLNPANGTPFADNGAIPDGSRVAFIQSFTGGSSSLSTTIQGLTAGQKYTVNFRFNARKAGTPNTPVLKIYVDDQYITGLSTINVDGTNPYRYGAFDFVASGETATLRLVNDYNGDTTILLDNFTINISTNNWSFAPWNNDETSGVDSSKNYTHAYNFGGGSAPDVTINGVTFRGIVGATPTVLNKFRSSLASVYSSDDANNITGTSATLSKRFIYGGNPGIFTIAGLVPGKEYIATFYMVAWEDGFRSQTFSYGNDRMTINQDHYGNNNGIRVMYRYIAPESGAIQLVQSPSLPANTMHLAGFANYEVDSSPLPVVGLQPVSHVVVPGTPITFRITAGGAQPLSFQWYKDGTPLQNQTNMTLIINSVASTDLGEYYVVVSNPNGSATSRVANLTFGQIANSGFEANIFDMFPGYISGNQPISGWFASDTARVGINPLADGQSPFANNGAIPEGKQVAFLQSVAGAPKSMWTFLNNLTPEENYLLYFHVNARDYNNTRPTLRVAIDDQKIGEFSVMPVSGTNSYRIVAFPFTVQNSTAKLSFTNDFNADSAVLIDNIRIEKHTTRWSFTNWTGDATSGIDSRRGVSHAVNLGAPGFTVDAIINGVRFQAVTGPNPWNYSFTMTNFTAAYSGDSNNVTTAGGGSAVLAQSFIYHSGTMPANIAQTLTLSNLIPGVEYELTIFGVGWEAPPECRGATFIAGDDMRTINEDHYGLDNGIRVLYRYTADQTGTFTVRYIPTDRYNSFHTYGFVNQEASSANPPSFYRQPVGKTIAGGLTLILDALVGGKAPLYYQWQKDGQDIPNATNLILMIENVDGSATGEYRLVVSNELGVATSQVAIVEVGLTIANPSFEFDTFTNYPGYVSGNFPITGWQVSDPTRAGINPANGSPFANNGTVPEGSKVAFIQGDGCVLSQTVSGLVPGKTYYLKFWENSRSGYPAPNLEVTFGGQVVVPSHTVNSGEYKLVVSKPFLATQDSAVLAFVKLPGPLGGDSTVLIDSVAVLELPPTPPQFITHPTGGFVKQGTTVVLNAIVQGSMPISYQWRFNGAVINGATADTLILSNISLAQSGDYELVAYNEYGSTVSKVATVKVGLGFTELFNTGVDNSGNLAPGGSVDLHYQLIASADPLYPGPNAYILYDSWPVESGVYMLNGPNSKWISSMLIDPIIRGGSPDGAYIYRTTFILDTTDPSDALLNGKASVDNAIVDIKLNGVSTGITGIIGYNQFTSFVISNGFVAGLNTLDFVVTNIATTGNNPQALRVELDGVASPLLSTPPSLLSDLSDKLAYEGQNITLSVVAVGSAPLSYQWYYEGFELIDQTNRQLVLNRVSIEHEGRYYVLVSNPYGSVVSAEAYLTVAGPPLIELDPVDVIAQRGATATFEVSAISSLPMTYQWYWNDFTTTRPLVGQTNSILVLQNVSPTNSGEYYVVVSNAAGSSTSMVAMLVVLNTPPAASNYGTSIIKNSQAKIPISQILAYAIDPDNDQLSFVGVSELSANGGSVVVDSGYLIYTPPQDFVGEDQFIYTVSDGLEIATADVLIYVSEEPIPSFNSITIKKVENGFKLDFLGLSEKTYRIQRANKIIGPWEDISSRITSPFGLLEFIDTNPPATQGFYRFILVE